MMKMKVSYYLANPTGNMTILVETPVPAGSQPFFARQLMDAEPSAEQVGFVSPGAKRGTICLRMAGGEFCGNATMSTAALYCEKNSLSEAELLVLASGAKEPVPVQIRKDGNESYLGCVKMPQPSAKGNVELQLKGKTFCYPLMQIDGIAHLIVREPMERTLAETAVKLWCHKLETEALGLMFLDFGAGTLTPLVYVPSADTMYWESSCASGTAAVGACLAAENGVPVSAELKQPGGILCVDATPEGEVFLRGKVHFERHTSMFCQIDEKINNL